VAFLSGESERALARLVELESAASGDTDAAPLERLRGVRALAAALEADPAALTAVREALDGGATWDEVAEAAGLSASAAKYRWAGDDDTIAERQESSRRRKRDRPSSAPTDLPGLSVSDAAKRLGLTPQAIYQRVSRGLLEATTIELPDGRKYKRVFLAEDRDSDGDRRDGDRDDRDGARAAD
jgi:transposase-like protein